MGDKSSNAGKYGYLANNIALFSISNFVSKILVFLLVPLYTNVLSTKEYGVADILQVTLLLLVPAVTINIGEAALRFGIEKTDQRGSILRVGYKYVGIADAAVAIIGLAAMLFVPETIDSYLFMFIMLFVTDSLYEFLVLFFQGCEMVPIVVIGSITSTLTMILCNILFLLVIRIGLTGYIAAQVIAYAAASTVMLLMCRSTGIKLKLAKNKALEREMIDYGKPMILYSTGSWINNASDRYIVAALCGAAVNGVYGVAYKIPAILMVFQRIFAQAWQMSATKSYNDEESAKFYSSMFKAYNAFMVLGCAVLILIVRPVAAYMFRKDFYEAWRFVPPLLISVIFGALTGFLGSINLAYKDSKSMGLATGIGALINVILNLITVPFFGAMGAAWATAISYFTMSMMAYIFVKKHVDINGLAVRDAIGYALLLAESIIVIADRGSISVICSLVAVFGVGLIYFAEMKAIIAKLYSLLRGKLAPKRD